MKLFIINLLLVFATIESFKNGFLTNRQIINFRDSKSKRLYDISLRNKNDCKNKLNAVVSFPSPDLLRKPTAFSLNKLVSSLRGVIILSMGMFFGLKSKFKKNIKLVKNNPLESGWTKRGYGGSLSRTVEVWGFAISFIYKFVSIYYIFVTFLIMICFLPIN
jgi:hypothetical protein